MALPVVADITGEVITNNRAAVGKIPAAASLHGLMVFRYMVSFSVFVNRFMFLTVFFAIAFFLMHFVVVRAVNAVGLFIVSVSASALFPVAGSSVALLSVTAGSIALPAIAVRSVTLSAITVCSIILPAIAGSAVILVVAGTVMTVTVCHNRDGGTAGQHDRCHRYQNSFFPVFYEFHVLPPFAR